MTKKLTMTLEFGDTTIFSCIPMPCIVYDTKEKNLEIGIYFLKYFLTLNIRK